ncbi:MAG: NADH-ubiquinone dehydrogenase [Oricola sp.]
MSKSDLPEETMKSDNPFAAFGDISEMQKEAAEWMSGAAMPPFAGMSNLAVHPMAAMAAATAIGAGMASQFFGMMAGTMAGAMSATNMLANETTGGPPAPFGAANPLDFDLATGSFDDTKEEDPITHQPPVKAEAPAKAAPVKTAPAKPARVKAKPAPKAEKPVAPEPVALAAEPEPVASGRIEPLMPEDFVRPKPLAKPDMPDDLKAIAGVGPKLESVLNSLGIWTFAQIAALTPNEVAWVDDYLQFKGRIDRDEWIAQAKVLAAGK